MLTLHLGPMFAGKTTALIRLAKEEPRSLILRPIVDTRTPRFTVKSHDGLLMDAVATDGLDFVDVRNMDVRRILVDETQFFDKDSTIKTVDRWNWLEYDVHLFGLSLTAQGQSWPTISELAEIPGIKKVMYMANCAVCREPAIYTQRITPWGEISPENAVGGADDYEPRCFDHWSQEPVR